MLYYPLKPIIHMSRKQPLSIILLGEASSGKTALITRLYSDTFHRQYQVSIGADFTYKDLDVGKGTETVRIWDTPGIIQLSSCFGLQFWREARCCVLVYDITSRDSFRRVNSVREEFVNEAVPSVAEGFPFILVGNKTDREREREVGWSEAYTWARNHGDIPLFQTSAMSDSNVKGMFEEAARLAFWNKKSISSLL